VGIDHGEEEDITVIMCGKCNVALEKRRTGFRYLNHTVESDVLRCPKCGQVYVPEELAKGKISQLETTLEDK
jgi:ssDNA-binding Zn-finger/Zn-ribbon topoisomerase 1